MGGQWMVHLATVQAGISLDEAKTQISYLLLVLCIRERTARKTRHVQFRITCPRGMIPQTQEQFNEKKDSAWLTQQLFNISF